MSKSLSRRVDEIEKSFPTDTKEPVTDISFIIPGQPVEEFGRTFETFETCLKYCDENGIEYTKEPAPFGSVAYNFSTD